MLGEHPTTELRPLVILPATQASCPGASGDLGIPGHHCHAQAATTAPHWFLYFLAFLIYPVKRDSLSRGWETGFLYTHHCRGPRKAAIEM